MKKLLLSLIVVFVSMAFNTHEVQAKSKRKISKSQKAKFNKIAYESVWFSNLTHKQQMKYLKTVANLVMKLNRRGFSMEDSFINYLVPYADAAERINNGFIFDGANDDADFDTFLGSLNILGGPLDPGCDAPEQLCAPYLGMVCTGGTGKLACSNDSTPTCAARGSLECLRNTLQECGMNARGQTMAGRTVSGDFCEALDSTMRRGMERVRTHCTTGGRADTNYCSQAVARLDGVEEPPSQAETPTGADCEQMVRELAQTRDNRTDGDDSTANRNNDFWRNMTGFAQQACGHRSVTSAMNIFGTCSRSDMGGADGNVTRSAVNTYQRSSESAAFTRCISTLQSRVRERRDARIEELRSDESIPPPNLEGRVNNVNRIFQRQIDAIATSRNATGECSIREENQVTDGAGNAVNNELSLRNLMGLAEKIRNRQDLTPAEQNLFRAGTGLTLQQFRNAFCAAENHDAFKDQLRRSLFGNVRVNESEPYASAALGQARVARTKMGLCLASLNTVGGEDGSGCRLYEVSGPNMLRCASNSHPILAVNKSTRRCMLVTGYNRRVTGTTDVANIDGTTGSRNSSWQMTLNVRTPSGTSELTNYRSESFFTRDYQLQEYRCDGDRRYGAANPSDADSRMCWMRPRSEDPAHTGEAEAREIEL